MRYLGLSIAFLAFSAISSAQFLRASAHANLVTQGGNGNQTNETNWTISGATSVVDRTAQVNVGGGEASTEFAARFGRLTGRTHATLSAPGASSASSSGLFGGFNNFVGASFYDTLTLTGAGPVSLRLHFSLHSVNEDPDEETFAETQLKVQTFSSTLTPLNPGPIVHTGTGDRRTAFSLLVNGNAGNTFDLLGELSSLSSVIYGSGDSGFRRAESDALHTGSVWIEPVSGGFTSLSGSSYLEPVPEPLSVLALGLGSGLLLRRRRVK